MQAGETAQRLEQRAAQLDGAPPPNSCAQQNRDQLRVSKRLGAQPLQSFARPFSGGEVLYSVPTLSNGAHRLSPFIQWTSMPKHTLEPHGPPIRLGGPKLASIDF